MSRSIQFIRGGSITRLALPAVATLVLASCQTTAPNNTAEGDAALPEIATAAGPNTQRNTDKVYSDPLVVSAATSGAQTAGRSAAQAPGASGADSTLAAYAPADLSQLTMQPTAVNASRNSLFSTAPADAAGIADDQTTASAVTSTSASIVATADLPTRQVSPMRKSLFSAELRQPAPPEIDPAALPVESAAEQPIYSAENQPIYNQSATDGSLPASQPQTTQAQPAVAWDPAEPEQPQKRKWLASLKEMFGKKKD
ncbi:MULTISPECIES: hypothetical protein [Alphaproteobacteria]|uniref:Lipoprotein n=2 Tax=Alphaproteobacteria TaxID=28211 RepID=A0A512HHJ1_9HYPH|nr:MULTISPECIES: hypothetical protein [Alphaproteobacteria]GEO84913.1 hypothetical protein RNA01_18450 [Ciceribacter naphthalenivorans]GLR22847.1 hypothetical protein GCM10007920_26350 [Ciceribacter naphthalenivorans]GLT05703.1 hypothetical protein GCM10007926_26350 [Sphingomonas psychrolutea]